jgi:hypothetical protein
MAGGILFIEVFSRFAVGAAGIQQIVRLLTYYLSRFAFVAFCEDIADELWQESRACDGGWR